MPPPPAPPFDPDGPLDPNDPSLGVFGLPKDRDRARVVLIPVPYDATTSYGTGTAAGPEAIRRASCQLDLLDRRFGPVYEHGIHTEDLPREIETLSACTRPDAHTAMSRGGVEPGSEHARPVDRAGAEVNEHVRVRAEAALHEGRIPGVVGGEHSVSYGSILACTEHTHRRGRTMGVLQIDAHMDLRPAYEGLEWSHASVMHNVLRDEPRIGRLVQVGIRDFSGIETRVAAEHGERVRTHFDDALFDLHDSGRPWSRLWDQVVADLPDDVYLSVDIDGLDPSLCPNTGTPVPGGLGYRELSLLLERLAESGKRIVGFDLVEVCPGDENEWDANVGARVLYRLCGAAIRSIIRSADPPRT